MKDYKSFVCCLHVLFSFMKNRSVSSRDAITGIIFVVTLINLFFPYQTIKKEGVINLFYRIMWYIFSQQQQKRKSCIVHLFQLQLHFGILVCLVSELLNLLLLTLMMTILFFSSSKILSVANTDLL